MATVYLAQDRKHHRKVAIKILKPELAAALGPERFLREIEIAAGLTHPHILPLHDSGEAGGLLYYVMPFVEGQTLRGRLEREKQLPLEDALAITRDIAEALSYAHSHSVVHRDIKPENILFQVGHAVVSDFGIARAITAAAGARLTETGIAIGTPGYMSPEQASGREPVDGRSDLYSLGCVLYEMLAGEPPFTGPSAESIVRQHLSAPPPRVSAMRAAVTPAVEQAIARALAKTPADRFATAALFALALGAGAGAPQAPRRLSRTGVALALSAALVTIAGAVLFTYGKRAPALDANLLAVAPFDVLAPGLDLWHEGLADLLSRNLDGAGSIRTVPPTVVVRRWHGKADRASGTALGHRAGARLVLFGKVLKIGGDSVRLTATLLDVGSGNIIADVERRDVGARMDRLADSVTVSVLRELGRTRAVTGRLASMGSASLPAVKAFLRGEQYFRRAMWDSAQDSYRRAVALDTNFAIALWRMGSVGFRRGYYRVGRATNLAYLLRAGALNHRLAPRDSFLLAADSLSAAWMTLGGQIVDGDHQYYARRSVATLEEAVRRYPDDPEIWAARANARFSLPEYVGAWPTQSLEDLDEAIALDPAFAPAYFDASTLALFLRGPPAALRYTTAYLALDSTSLGASKMRVVERLLDAKSPLSPEVQRFLDTVPVEGLTEAFGTIASWPDSAESAVQLARLLVSNRRGSGDWSDPRTARRFLSVALDRRGHLREAYAAAGGDLAAFAFHFGEQSLFGRVPTDTAAAEFRRWLRTKSALTVLPLPWWSLQHDTTSILEVMRRCDSAVRTRPPGQTWWAQHGARAARAYLALARHDSAEALAQLLALPDSLCSGCVADRLVKVQLLEARGRDREAAALLDRFPPPLWLILPSAGFWALERGRVDERLGNRDSAVAAYRFVTDLWLHADPELQPYVTEARTALNRLSGEPR